MTAAARDLIMWVGSGPYPTWRAFADEAHAMGVCKRVRAVPRGIVVGQSKCYLLHGERISTKVPIRVHMFQKKTGICRFCGISRDGYSQNLTECNEHMVRRAGKPRSFLYGYFVIEDVLVVGIGQDAQDKLLKAHPGMNFASLSTESAEAMSDRHCGSLKQDAIYLRGPLTEFPEPKPWQGGSYVGFRYYTEGSP